MSVKISELPAAAAAAGSDQLPANQSGTTRRLTVDQVVAYAVEDLLGGSTEKAPTQAAVAAALDLKQDMVSGPDSQFVVKNAAGEVTAQAGYGYNSANGGTQWNVPVSVIDDNDALHVRNAQFNPTVASPNATRQYRNSFLEIDTDSDGFAFGTSGTALTASATTIKHFGTSNVGTLAINSGNFELGNGTDPISVKGFSFSYGFGSVGAGVTINGPVQGYGIQPNFNASATIDPATYFQGFYETSNCQTTWTGSWASFIASPSLAELSGANLTAININPSVSQVSDNGSINLLGVSANIGTMDSGTYFNGVLINPTIASVDGATLLGVYTDNVTGTNVKALDIRGDVNIQGDLHLSGGFNYNGPLQLYDSYTLISQTAGTVGMTFNFISQPTVAASATLTNADYLGVNTASLIQVGDNASVTTFLTGISALGLPAVATIGSGAVVDRVAGATFALSLDAGAPAGGTIQNVMLGQALAIPNGGTTVDRLYGWFADMPFGTVGTDSWGVYIKPAAMQNWFAGAVRIGGTAGTTDRVTNDSIELELTAKALRLAVMTTTERDALTAVTGMVVFNSTTGALETYDGAAWV